MFIETTGRQMLSIRNLTKIYPGGKKAVNNFSLDLEDSQIMGFIGPNGAGKTTTINCCSGILPFDQGEILIDGKSILTEVIEAKKRLAYVPDNPDLYEYLTGIQYLNFISDIFKVTSDDRKKRITDLAEIFEIPDALSEPISVYSHGMKQKLALIGAFVHEPRLLILDEPFVGLDPKAFHSLKTILTDFKEKGSSVFFSSHILDVVEKICNDVAIIRDGELIYSGSMTEIRGNESLEQAFLELTDHENN
jgi:ABC-2 type transport system ATP-binding protein